MMWMVFPLSDGFSMHRSAVAPLEMLSQSLETKKALSSAAFIWYWV